MSRWIDADVYEETLRKWLDGASQAYESDIVSTLEDCIWELDAQTTVDAVEVIRCKDCKYWADGVSGCTDHVKCCKIGYYMVGENGYCVYGERKTDER